MIKRQCCLFNKIRGIYMKVIKAVIPAAGLGTRFLPAIKALAKEMLPIIDTNDSIHS